MGGKSLRATGKCVFAMRITGKIDFQEYWSNPRYISKRPVRNGSNLRLVGDNIYHRDGAGSPWQQADSPHSHQDGSPNPLNIETDTKSDKVLLSTHFYYFGREAPAIPPHILEGTGFKNGIGHRRFSAPSSHRLIMWIERSFPSAFNRVVADPFDFDRSERRYSGKGSKVI
jgi:hypothetical protein